VQLAATVKDSAGATLTGRVVTWSTSASGVATISSAGLVTGVAAGTATITATSEGKSGTATVTVTAPPPPPPPPAGAAVFVGAGDIATCSAANDEATATLLDSIPGTVFTAGDNVYDNGTATEFTNCYNPSWGRHKARTFPAPGNHDYNTSGATGYYGYFGAAAGPSSRGYYSYDLGTWHIISLNSNVSMSTGSAQEVWLRQDLAATTKKCLIAYWHHPRFSSGTNHGSSTSPQPLWQALYDAGAEIVISGHEHHYERFAPQTPTGVADPNGIREFVIGTGGASGYPFGTPIANSEVRSTGTFGVLKLTLADSSYAWEFVPVAGKTFRDTGTGNCVSRGTPPPPPASVGSVTVTPSSTSVQTGGTAQLTATAKDSAGATLTGRTVTWTSNASSTASVSSSGTVTGVAAGSATVTATSEGKSGTATVAVVAPPPPPPPPTGTSCLAQTGSLVTLSGLRSTTYETSSLAAGTKIDARTAQFLVPQSVNVATRVGGANGICWSGGEILGQFAPTTSWATMHDKYGMIPGSRSAANRFQVENLTVFNYGDAISFDVQPDSSWTIRNVYVKYSRDDCIENDFLNAGTIDSSFFDGCYDGVSAQEYTGTPDGTNNVITIRNTLIRLQSMDAVYSGTVPNHNAFWKWSAKGPSLALYNNVFRADGPSKEGNGARMYMAPPPGKLVDCENNVMVWLGSGSFPETLPTTFNGKACFTLMTGAAGLQFWKDAVAGWNAAHPNALADVGSPVVSLFSPGISGSSTLTGVVTLVATAVDDRAIAGVQLQLNGANIGAEILADGASGYGTTGPTKYNLSWDSRTVANGTYTLTATARDAAGHVTTATGVTVTVSN